MFRRSRRRRHSGRRFIKTIGVGLCVLIVLFVAMNGLDLEPAVGQQAMPYLLGGLIVVWLVIAGAFFTVWTISRSGDLAVLRALGASTAYLLRDSLGQAVVVLVAGIGVGSALSALAATALAGVVPVVVDAATVLVPALALLAVGLLGAVAAVVRVGRVDPHAALAAGR